MEEKLKTEIFNQFKTQGNNFDSAKLLEIAKDRKLFQTLKQNLIQKCVPELTNK